jgi:hypothetical protein
MLGCFVLISSTLDLFGVLPHSFETPPLGVRLARHIPLLIFSLAFVVPYRRITSPVAQSVTLSALIVSIGWALYVSATGWHGYAAGERTWHVVPFSIILCTIVIANILAFASLVPRSRNV